MAAKSYLDPSYASLAASMEQRFGLPGGLLHNIVTKGERSNADQVSEAGAKTVFQIIPATRKAALEKYGVDAYLSAENAAEVAARLLKDSLDRNAGDVKTAVAEYHGGTDPRNWGARTKAYVGRVTSTFDKVKAQRAETQEAAAPSIARVYDAYKAGQLTAEERAQFEADVQSGAVMLPRGAKVDVKPKAAVLPAGVVQAYSNLSEMSDAERDQIDADIAAGIVAPPAGAVLKRPAARTALGSLGMGARNVMEGAGGLVDIAAGPLGSVMDAVIPGDQIAPDPARKLMGGLADALHLPEPATKGEQLTGALIEGGTQGVLSAGAGMALAPAKGATGVVARALADNPVTDVVASAAGAGSMEAADQAGVGPVGQVAIGLATGGFAGVGVKTVERVATRFGPKAAKVVETTPREVVIDERGALTEEGREVAARQGLTPEEVKGAYDEAAKPEPRTVRTYEGVDYPVQIIDESPVDHQGVPHLKVRGEDGAEGSVPAAEVRQVDDAAPAAGKAAEAPEAAAAAKPADDAPLPASAQARAEQAASEGVTLTRGQATQDFAAQDAEQTLKAQATGEGEKARQFYAQQQEQIKAATDRFKEAFGDTTATAAERGALVKDALRDLRDAGKAGVTALYNQARTMAEGMGEAGSNLIALDTDVLLARMRELFIDEAVPEATRKALKQQAAKYGLIGENPRTVEGETTVQLKDSSGEVGGKVTFTGLPRRLDIVNAEDLRKKVNELYEPGKANPQDALKALIDDAVEGAVERAATEGQGNVGQAFRAARAAHVEQKSTFAAKDIIQKLIAWKKGTKTDEVLPENAIKAIFAGGKDSVSDVKKVKAVLLSKPTEQSRAAWKAIQAHGVADIFEQALSPRGEISGARLNSAIKKFGADKLKVLLDPADFNQLMKLRRIIGDATIPLANTTNPSGSGYKVIAFLAQQSMRLASVAKIVPGVGPLVDTAAGLVKTGREAAASKKTLEGVTSFTPEAAANADAAPAKADPLAFVRKFLSVAGSDEIIAPIIASAANEERP